MATPGHMTLQKFIAPNGGYSSTELTALQKNLDTKGSSVNSVFHGRGQAPYPIQSTFDRKFCASEVAVVLTSGRVQLTRFTAERTQSITGMSPVVRGTAAAATPTLVRYGLYTINDSTGDITLVASTTTDTALMASTNARAPKALTTPYTIEGGRDYFAAILATSGGALPICAGLTFVAADISSLPIPSYQVSSLTDLGATHVFADLVASLSLFYIELY